MPAEPAFCRLDFNFDAPWRRRLYGLVQPALERMLGVKTLNELYDATMEDTRDVPYMLKASSVLDLHLHVDPADLARIPKTGPLVVVANHPFGGVEGVLLAELLHQVRPDWKLMANSLLSRLPESSERLIMVDPFGGDGSHRRNLAPLKQSIGWLRSGGVLGIFPAGEVAHYNFRERRIVDSPWSETIAKLVRKTGVPVLPIFFEGRTGLGFQVAGMIHERLRTALLVRELLKRRGGDYRLRIGNVIPAARLQNIASDADLTDFLRLRTCILANRSSAPAPAPVPAATAPTVPTHPEGAPRPVVAPAAAASASEPGVGVDADADAAPISSPEALLPGVADPHSAVALAPPASAPAAPAAPRRATTSETANRIIRDVFRSSGPKREEPIVAPIAPEDMAEEIAVLGEAHRLVATGDFVVYRATADQIPKLLQEIGRLREVTFRLTGEGTGKSIDLDRFDQWYDHIFMWDRKALQVVGAYRLGKADRIVEERGREGLYSYTLFHYHPRFHTQIRPALELGRSFIQPAYQRNYQTLLLLWKGICRYVVLNQQYRYLFGPVSIASDYQRASHQLIVDYLTFNRFEVDLARYVRARTPFRRSGVKGWRPTKQAHLLTDEDDVSDMVSDIELEGKGIPVLLRQYLKLGGRILGFNLDPDFSDVLDGLILVDMVHGENRLLTRLMGREGRESYLAYHREHAAAEAQAGAGVGN